MKPLRVAILGAGAMGAHHARVFAAIEGVIVSGVHDPRMARATALSTQVRSHACSCDDAIGGADMVVIATPIETHAHLVFLALERAKHVLVEKPICTDGAVAYELARAASSLNRVLAVGHSERFNPAVRALFERTIEDPLVRLDTIRLSMPSTRSPHANVLLNLATHDLDLALFLARSTTSAHLISIRGDADWAYLTTRSPSGFVATHEVARAAGERYRSLTAQTRSGRTYEADLLSGTLVEKINERAMQVATMGEEPLAAQARAFISRVRGAGEGFPLATALDAAHSVDLANEAERAIFDPRNVTPRVTAG